MRGKRSRMSSEYSSPERQQLAEQRGQARRSPAPGAGCPPSSASRGARSSRPAAPRWRRGRSPRSCRRRASGPRPSCCRSCRRGSRGSRSRSRGRTAARGGRARRRRRPAPPPGCTRAHISSRLISSTWRKCTDRSSTTASPTACPASEVPPPRGSTGAPASAATRTASATSAVWRGDHHPERFRPGRCWRRSSRGSGSRGRTARPPRSATRVRAPVLPWGVEGTGAGSAGLQTGTAARQRGEKTASPPAPPASSPRFARS